MASAYIPRLGHVTLSVADRTLLISRSPAPTCEIDIVDIEYDFSETPSVATITALTVKGLAWGVSKVDLTVQSAAITTPLAAQPTVGTAGTWSRTFTLAAPLPVGTTIQVLAVAPVGGSCNASASLSLALQIAPDPVVTDPGSCSAGFQHERNRFVAGHPDRLVRTRSFVPLVASAYAMTKHQKSAMAKHMTHGGVSRRKAHQLVDGFASALSDAGRIAMRKLGTVSETEARRSHQATYKKAVTAALRTMSKLAKRLQSKRASKTSHKKAAIGTLPGGVDVAIKLPPASVGALVGKAAVGADAAVAQFQASLGTVNGTNVNVTAGVTKYALSAWLGVLFYDRLRFRAAGLVAGEQVYSLALAPGEEVTLTQRSETKRSRSFEEVLDRTTERELEFTSTWSTDFTQSDTNSQTTSIGGNLGLSVGVPIEGIEIGVNEGVSVQSSSTISSQVQRTRSQEVTSRFAAKSKEQHKTTFKVSTDITEEFGSKRMLRNPNPSRALTLNFYKLYQKFRVLLERSDAKLCLAFCIADPGEELRRELEGEFSKLDPKVPSGVCAEMPTGGTTHSTRVIENRNAEDWGGEELGRETFSTVLPPNTVLSAWKFEITRWLVDDGDGNTYYADTSEFFSSGGDWKFWDEADKPVIGQSGAQSHYIWVTMPEAFGPGWWTVSVEGRMKWDYVPTDAITAEVQSCIEAAKKAIRDSFSVERVLQMLNEVKSGRQELVLQRLFKTVLLRDYYTAGVNPPCAVLERVRNLFDWKEAVIEYLPWWMTPGGSNHREELRKRLLGMSGDTPSDIVIDDALVASAAHVYLPIRAGCESEALTFLMGVDSIAGTNLAATLTDFSNWRDNKLGALTWPLPDYTDVLAPTPSIGTESGQTAWTNDWEKARRKFLVLDEWSELLPTDGVHIEPGLSSCGSADEFRSSALRADLLSTSSRQAVENARAELESSLAGKPLPATTIVIGDPHRLEP